MKVIDMMKKVLMDLAIILSVFMVFVLCYFKGLVSGLDFNGITILIGLCLFLNPLINLYKINKKVINNNLYYLAVILGTTFITFVTIKGITFCFIDSNNNPQLYFYSYLLYMVGIVLLLILLSVFVEKEKVVIKKDNSRFLLLLVALSFSYPFLDFVISLSLLISGMMAIFAIIMIFKLNGLNIKEGLQKSYLILLAGSLLTNNIIGLILMINIYLQLDYFGLNI